MSKEAPRTGESVARLTILLWHVLQNPQSNPLACSIKLLKHEKFIQKDCTKPYKQGINFEAQQGMCWNSKDTSKNQTHKQRGRNLARMNVMGVMNPPYLRF
jgi:hypothetical protein